MSDDNIEQVLRLALDAQARRIDVAPDALTTIRARTRQRRRVRRGGFMVTLGTGTGVLAASAVLAFASVTGGCQSRPSAAQPPAVFTPTSVPTGAAPSSTPSATASTSSVRVPVYYIGSGNRLYREYHQVAVVGGASTTSEVGAAVAQLFGKTALDPDYHSGWATFQPAPTVSVSGGVTTIDLHSDASPGSALTPVRCRARARPRSRN